MNLVNNERLREEVMVRMEKLGFTASFLCADAAERGMAITRDRFSKYVKGKKGGLTDEQLLWVATRLGIYININLGKPVISEGKLKWVISPYQEQECLNRLKLIFGK